LSTPGHRRVGWLALACRAATVCFGLAAAGWGIFAAPLVWRQASMAAMTEKIVGGEQFAPGVLEDFVASAAPSVAPDICQPVTLRTMALIRLRFAEQAIGDGDHDRIDRTLSDLDAALHRALSCAPTDAFLWFAVFWMQNNTRGLQAANYRSLRMSYRVGANEGWVALRRNRFSVALYPGLPDDLKAHAIDEFVQLVKSDFITEAADVLVGPGKPVSAMLLARLQGIDSQKLRFLVTMLDAKGFEGKIPWLPKRAADRSELAHAGSF
jgi:hypothetical protein